MTAALRWLLCCTLAAAAAPAGAAESSSPAAPDPYASLVRQLAGAADARERARADLLAGGMPAHDALQSGDPSTAALRADLRRQIRQKRDAAARANGLVVHEWGMLSYAQGTEGGRLDFQRDDKSDVPDFVHAWSDLARPTPRDDPGMPGGIRIDFGGARLEKPIVYFYADKPQTIRFAVACPRGLLTQWYPAARVTPEPAPIDPKDLPLGGASVTWRNVDLLPPGPPGGAPAPPALPPTPEKAWWWPLCRAVDATPLAVGGAAEKFLMYRGQLSALEPPLVTVDGGAGGKYALANTARRDPVRRLLVLRVSGKWADARALPPLAPGGKVDVEIKLPSKPRPAPAVADELTRLLTEWFEEEGLFPKEAAAMARVCRKLWLEKEGVRLIYANPPAAISAVLPISMDPRPADLVRVLLTCVECLGDSKANVVAALIKDLGNGTYKERERAQRQLVDLGPGVIPDLVQAAKATADEETRNRLRAILRRIDPKSKALEELEANPIVPDPDQQE